MAKENVNHPKHYNSHPAGIECIDIIRHYTCDIANALKYLWRAGLKAELGKDDADKEIEDLNKALWYIEDYLEYRTDENIKYVQRSRIAAIVRELTDHTIEEITNGYVADVADAMSLLLCVGVVRGGEVRHAVGWPYLLAEAVEKIQNRVITIHRQLLDADIDDMQKIIRGEWVEGLDTVKPACKREDEPADYDPMNLIIIQGTAYGLSAEVHKKDNGALYSPCDLCHFHDLCASPDGCGPNKLLCWMHQADNQEYYREVGDVRYAPSFGTITIVDPKKELEKQMKEMEEEEQ